MDPKTKPGSIEIEELDVTLTQEIELPLNDDEEDEADLEYDDTLQIEEL